MRSFSRSSTCASRSLLTPASPPPFSLWSSSLSIIYSSRVTLGKMQDSQRDSLVHAYKLDKTNSSPSGPPPSPSSKGGATLGRQTQCWPCRGGEYHLFSLKAPLPLHHLVRQCGTVQRQASQPNTSGHAPPQTPNHQILKQSEAGPVANKIGRQSRAFRTRNVVNYEPTPFFNLSRLRAAFMRPCSWS